MNGIVRNQIVGAINVTDVTANVGRCQKHIFSLYTDLGLKYFKTQKIMKKQIACLFSDHNHHDINIVKKDTKMSLISPNMTKIAKNIIKIQCFLTLNRWHQDVKISRKYYILSRFEFRSQESVGVKIQKCYTLHLLQLLLLYHCEIKVYDLDRCSIEQVQTRVTRVTCVTFNRLDIYVKPELRFAVTCNRLDIYVKPELRFAVTCNRLDIYVKPELRFAVTCNILCISRSNTTGIMISTPQYHDQKTP